MENNLSIVKDQFKELPNSFIKEAISKIEINKYYQSRNKLPPFPK